MASFLDRRMMNNQGQGGMVQPGFYSGPGGAQNAPLGIALFGSPTEGEAAKSLNENKRKLAKRANEIYRSLCHELELGECFFNDFRLWSEFVEGRISETSFYEKAKEEAHTIAGRQE